MKKLLVIATAFTLMIMPFGVYAQPDQTATVYPQSQQAATGVPPVSQPLIAEGDFALKLVTALKLGTPTTETEAESMLTSVGIAPKNGWIADYPMAPIIIGQVQDALVAAANAKKVPMGKNDALQAFRGLTTELGLVITPAPGEYAEGPPPASSEYVQPTVVNNYYYNEGPPVVTYYPPPWDYYYLYTWVPYPFWWSGCFLPGFFILNDFDIVVVGHHFHHDHDFDHGHYYHHVITNHWMDPRTHVFFRVDPTTRTFGRAVNVSGTHRPRAAHASGFTSPEARKGAGSIFNRSRERERFAPVTVPAGRTFAGTFPRAANGRTFSRPGTIERQERTPQERSTGTGRFFTVPAGRSFSRPSEDFRRSFGPPRRSFGMPSSRTFGRPSQGFGRSFNSPTRSLSAPPVAGRSPLGGFRGGGLEGFHAGGLSGGFRGGGLGGSYGAGGLRR
jgi:hypothetical protein